MKRIFLYGLAGPEEKYRVVRYECMNDEYLGIRDLVMQAAYMARNPSIKTVYAIDDRRGLCKEYLESIKKYTIESCAIFKDILEREGVKVL